MTEIGDQIHRAKLRVRLIVLRRTVNILLRTVGSDSRYSRGIAIGVPAIDQAYTGLTLIQSISSTQLFRKPHWMPPDQLITYGMRMFGSNQLDVTRRVVRADERDRNRPGFTLNRKLKAGHPKDERPGRGRPPVTEASPWPDIHRC